MINLIKSLCFQAIIKEFPKLHKQLKPTDIDISPSKENIHAHFQFNDAMKLASKLEKNPIDVANEIKKYIEKKTRNKMFNINVTGPGFINFTIKNNLINKKIKHIFKNQNKNQKKEKIIIDYSSPNIAKDMHVGHLRSTIIGDCLAKILTYLGNNVLKISHLGDWGTQFGTLICYIKEINKSTNIKKLKLDNLSKLYKEAYQKFEIDEEFKNKSKKEVIALQNKNYNSLNIWKIINKISKKEYKKIYELLDIKIKYKGESFYNDMLTPIIKFLEKNTNVITSDKAKCIYIDGFNSKNNTPLPLIIQKSDKGFNYATTDLATLYYRIKYHKANKIIYITDIGQKIHFDMVFKSIEKCNIKEDTKLIHIPVGLILTKEGKKIKTRSGNSEKLINLLKISIKHAKKALKEKNKNINKKMLKENSKILGINTIKYADLSNKIDKNYIFEYKKMIQFNGNTAAFLNYAYVRINSIKNKVKKLNQKEKQKNEGINIQNKSEIDLSIHILQYNNIIEKTANELNPNILTFYLYKLAEKFHIFFHECNIIRSENKNSRLFLCKITEKILKTGMILLGLNLIKKM